MIGVAGRAKSGKNFLSSLLKSFPLPPPSGKIKGGKGSNASFGTTLSITRDRIFILELDALFSSFSPHDRRRKNQGGAYFVKYLRENSQLLGATISANIKQLIFALSVLHPLLFPPHA